MTGVTIAKDSEGYRLELGHSDPSALAKHGPYELNVQDEDLIFITVEKGLNEHNITGCRSGDRRGIRVHGGDRNGMTQGRFGPCPVDADLDNPDGFIASLPPLHERPWPSLRDNESYDVGEQIVVTLAERVKDRIDFCGMPLADAIKLEGRKIPPNQRQFLPKGCPDLLRIQMSKLELPLESH